MPFRPTHVTFTHGLEYLKTWQCHVRIEIDNSVEPRQCIYSSIVFGGDAIVFKGSEMYTACICVMVVFEGDVLGHCGPI